MDEADADLTLQLIFEARLQPLGKPVTLNRSALLQAMGRNTGKAQYDWLLRRMKALTVATLFIEAKKSGGATKYKVGDTEAFHIIQSFGYDRDNETYTFTLDPRWCVLFGNREFAMINWEKRLQIGRGQDMAKALQRLLAASSDRLQRFALDWLKSKMRYGGRMRDFKTALNRAILELMRLDILDSGRVEVSTKAKGKEQLAVWLSSSA